MEQTDSFICDYYVKDLLLKILFNNCLMRQRASLIVQLVKIHLQCRRQEFDPWSGKIPHAAGKLDPYTTATEPVL